MSVFDRRGPSPAVAAAVLEALDRPIDRLRSIVAADDGTEADPLERSSGDADAAGDRTERARSPATAAPDDASTETAPHAAVEFVDCETVRITGAFDEVGLSLFWWDENGSVGTISEPVGGVDGDRTIVASDEFGAFAIGPIVTGVDLYDPGSPVVPGGGDASVANPDLESCVRSVREAYDGRADLEEPFPERSAGGEGRRF